MVSCLSFIRDVSPFFTSYKTSEEAKKIYLSFFQNSAVEIVNSFLDFEAASWRLWSVVSWLPAQLIRNWYRTMVTLYY